MGMKRWYQRWLGRPRSGQQSRSRQGRLTVEALEDRRLLAVTVWTGANFLVDDNWSDPANWSNGVPGPADTAEFNSDSVATQWSTVDIPFTIGGLLMKPMTPDGPVGTIRVNAPLVLTGSSEWDQGGIYLGLNGGRLTNNGTMTVNVANNQAFGGLGGAGTFTNIGTILLVRDSLPMVGYSNNSTDPQATLDNAATGVIELQSDGGIVQHGSGYPVLTNEGTIKKTGGTGTSTINMPLTNTGMIDAESGTISLAAGAVDTNGTFRTGTGAAIDLANGSTFTENGTFTATGSGTLVVPQFATLNSGPTGATFKVPSTVTFSLNGGTVKVSAPATLTYDGPLSIDGSGFASLTGGGTFLENGTITVSATGGDAGLAINDGNSTSTTLDIAPGSTLNFLSDSGVFTNCCGLGLESLVNAGTIEKTGGTGTSSLSVPISNTGTIGVYSGTLAVTRGTFTNSGGLVVAARSAVQVPNDYTQTATGSFQPILAGPTSFGQLQVSGQATLDGALKVSTANSFSPTAGQSFAVLTAGSVGGTFAALSGLSFANGVSLQPAYSSTAVVLQAAQTAAPAVSVPGLNATAGQPFNGVVATIRDAAGGMTAARLRATIAWGDGQTSAGTVSANGDGTFSVHGTNTYAQAGSYAVAVTVEDMVTSQSAAGQGTATVDAALAPPRPITARLITVKVGRRRQLLMIDVLFADTGAEKERLPSPFQRPAFRNIQVSVRDSNSDGVPDQVVVTARRGRRTVTAVFPG
jgi:hypothetical protein